MTSPVTSSTLGDLARVGQLDLRQLDLGRLGGRLFAGDRNLGVVTCAGRSDAGRRAGQRRKRARSGRPEPEPRRATGRSRRRSACRWHPNRRRGPLPDRVLRPDARRAPRALPVRGGPGCAALRFPSCTCVECSTAAVLQPSRGPPGALHLRAPRLPHPPAPPRPRGPRRAPRAGPRSRPMENSPVIPPPSPERRKSHRDRQQRRRLLAQRAERRPAARSRALARAAGSCGSASRAARGGAPRRPGACPPPSAPSWRASPRSGAPRRARCTRSRAGGARGTARSRPPAA